MGIRKLNKFLTNKECLISYNNLYNFKEKFKKDTVVIGIDFWLYVHKFLHSNKSSNIILGFWNQIIKFLSNKMIPIYIIDGDIPIEKRDEINKRQNSKNNKIKKISELKKNENDNKVKIEKLEKQVKRLKHSDLNKIKTLFSLLNIPLIRADYEADSLIAKLYKSKIIDTCLSDDMDILVMGCGSMIKFDNGKVIEYNLKHILNKLNFTHEKLIDMSIVLGCDYLKHPIKIDLDILYNLLLKYDDLFDIIESDENDILSNNNSYIKILGENYENVRYIYLLDKEILPDIPNNILKSNMKYINSNNVIKFFKNEDWFNINYNSILTIRKHIDHINHIFIN